MKKKPATRKMVSALIMTLVSLAIFRQGGLCSCAMKNVKASERSASSAVSEASATARVKTAMEEGGTDKPPESLTRVFELVSDETAQVPRRIVEGNAVYELDESSIVVEVNGNGSAEGADVVTFSRKVADLSDNDLSRIEKEAVIEGISCELLNVVYKVEEEDKNGMPTRYSAACQYGGLKKYSTSFPVAWRMTAQYNFCETITGEEIVKIREETKEENTRSERVGDKGKSEAGNVSEKEEAIVPKAAGKGFRIKPGPESGEKEKIPDGTIPFLAAAAAGAVLTVPFIIWVFVLTAPLYALKRGERYRYIGRIRLKKEKGMYVAYLTKRLYMRAGLPVFRIRISERMQKRSKSGMLQIHCPGGKRIMATIGKIVCFTVEGD